MKQKTTFFTRLVACMLILALAISLSPVTGASAKKPKTTVNMKEKTVKAYTDGLPDGMDTKIYFNGKGDIPYFDLEYALDNTMTFLGMSAKDKSLSVKRTKNTLVWTRNNGGVISTVTYDFKKNTIVISDLEEFLRKDGYDLVYFEDTDSANDALLEPGGTNYSRHGKSLNLDLNKYGVKILKDKKKDYIPVQTYNDLFFSKFTRFFLYNGEALILGTSNKLSADMKEKYYKPAPKKMSKEYAAFNYGELCLALDLLYGLKESHNIKSFDEFFTETGLGSLIKSQDAAGTDTALITAINLYFDDIHCGYGERSYNSSEDAIKKANETIPQGAYRSRFIKMRAELREFRSKYYPDGFVPYQEVGDTAYITFDSFALDPTKERTSLPTDADLPDLATDTVGLMQYALGKITREGSPIKRVVLDLSTNGGGVGFTACYVLAAFLGSSSISIMNMTTGAQSFIDKKGDLNLDGVFDEKDTLANRGLKLYCVESGCSYSCGNLVPCVFKDSGKVTLIGRTSGGGSCIVQPMCTASGTTICLSGPNRLSFSKNGAFYDVDRGAEPDVYIEDMSKVYDRAYLNAFLDKVS